MDTLQIQSGVKRLAVERDGEQVGEIKFNPSDAEFAERFYVVVSEFNEKIDVYRQRHLEINMNASSSKNGIPDNAPEQIQILRETCEYVRGRIDYLFGENTSSVVFGDSLVLESFEQFFDQILPYIKSARSDMIGKYRPQGHAGHGNGKKTDKRSRPRKK